MNLAVTTKFKSAVEKINQIDTGKFPLVLTRIIQKLHLKEDSIFDGKEEAQLCKMLGMSEADLDTVISACSYIFEQAAYDQVAVGALEENLLTVGMIAAQVCGPRGGEGGVETAQGCSCKWIGLRCRGTDRGACIWIGGWG